MLSVWLPAAFERPAPMHSMRAAVAVHASSQVARTGHRQATRLTTKSNTPPHTVWRGVRIHRRSDAMPIDEFLKNFTPGDDFDFEKFRAEAAEEAEKDRTNANAAIAAKETELTATKTELEKTRAAAWLAYNNAEAGDADRQPPAEVDPNSVEEIRKRVFKPLNRK